MKINDPVRHRLTKTPGVIAGYFYENGLLWLSVDWLGAEGTSPNVPAWDVDLIPSGMHLLAEACR